MAGPAAVQTTRQIEVRGRTLGNGQAPAVCIPLVSRDGDSLLAELEAVLALRPDLVEWRADFYESVADTTQVVTLARELKRRADGVPLLFTLRSDREGGEPCGLSDAQTAGLCVAVCDARAADLVDVEMSAAAESLQRVLAACRDTGTLLLLSFHDFERTPGEEALFAKFAAAQRLGGDVAKVAVMPQSMEDVLALLSASLRASRELSLPVIAIAMGPLGAVTRVAGGMFGSAVTFAAGPGRSAPGQLPAAELHAALALLGRAQSGS